MVLPSWLKSAWLAYEIIQGITEGRNPKPHKWQRGTDESKKAIPVLAFSLPDALHQMWSCPSGPAER
jgi:hypothetical protein